MDNKSTVISVIWIVIAVLIIVLVTQMGMELIGTLIMLGIAVAMTFAIMGYKSNE